MKLATLLRVSGIASAVLIAPWIAVAMMVRDLQRQRVPGTEGLGRQYFWGFLVPSSAVFVSFAAALTAAARRGLRQA